MALWTKFPGNNKEALAEMLEIVHEEMSQETVREFDKADFVEKYGLPRDYMETFCLTHINDGWADTFEEWVEEVGVQAALASFMMLGLLLGIRFRSFDDHYGEEQ
jgi:hypothetical protein